MDYYSDFSDIMGTIVGSMAAGYLFNFIFTLVLYILRSMGLFGLAKNRGMGSGGAAWIPCIGGPIMTGAVADNISKKNGSNSVFRFLIPFGALLSWILIGVGVSSWIPMLIEVAQYGDPEYIMEYMMSGMMAGMSLILLACLVALAVYIIQLVALHKIYKCYRPGSSTVWTVLSVIFPFMQSIFPFMLRNDVPFAASAPPSAGYYPQPAQPYAPPPAQPYTPPPAQPYTPPPTQPYAPPPTQPYAPPQNDAAPYNPFAQPQDVPPPPPIPEQPVPPPPPDSGEPWEK